jgi:hypothetical protein
VVYNLKKISKIAFHFSLKIFKGISLLLFSVNKLNVRNEFYE